MEGCRKLRKQKSLGDVIENQSLICSVYVCQLVLQSQKDAEGESTIDGIVSGKRHSMDSAIASTTSQSLCSRSLST